MIGIDCHSHVGDVYVRAAQLHILQFGVGAVGAGVARLHHFARDNPIVDVFLGLHAGFDQPVHHFSIDARDV